MNVPKLRFPEFSGEWEEKKLSDIASFRNERSSCEIQNYVSTENLRKDYLGVVFSDSNHGQIAGIKYSENDILFGNIRPYLKKVWLANKSGCVNSDVLVFHIKKDYPKFINNIICNDLFLSHVMNGVKGTKMPRGDKKQIMTFIAKIPSLAEQQKIADFLSTVDSIITTETKILNALQKKKKALMQKLFTQQLRFKSNDGTDFPAWEEKKLITEFPFIRNGFVGVVTDFFTTEIDGIKYIEGTNIHDGMISSSINLFVTKEFHNTHKNSQLKENDILMVQSGHVGETAVVPKELENSNCHALIIMSNGGNCSSEYVNYYFQSNKGKKQLSILTTGSTIKHILASDMQKFICPFPCREEQQKIADCLSSIDSLIQTQQKVVTTWQKRKKALLQQMFI